MGILDFAHYLRPYRWRLALAMVFMIGVGFFGAANLIAVKPVVEIIVGEMTVEQYRARRAAREAERQSEHALPTTQWWRARTDPVRRWIDDKVEAFYLFASQNPRRALIYVAGVILLFTVIKAVSEYYSKYHMAYSLYAAMLEIKEDLFDHIIRQDSAFFMRNTAGFLESRINSDVNALIKVFDAVIREAFQQPVTLVFLLAVLFFYNWQLTLIAIVVIPVAAAPISYYSRKLRKVTKRSQERKDELASYAIEALRNYQIVKIYDSENFEAERFRRKNSKLFHYFLKRRVAAFAQSPIVEVLGTIGAVAVLIYGGHMVTSDNPAMSGSDFIIYIVCLTQFYTPIRKLTKVNVNWQTGLVSAQRIGEMLQVRSEVVEKPDAVPLDRIREGIRLEGVSFHYGETAALDDVTLAIPLGRVVALVGRSGAGKTTLAGLLPRLYDPSEGRVLIDGRPAWDYRLSDLRRRFGVVPQGTILFNDTIARNIAYAEEGEIDMARVERAARQAHAHDFIMALDGGLAYETNIGQGGDRLSGGQRQRIAIARAIYRDPEVLIFDEATSALDEESQRHVQNAIDNLLKGRTAVVIAHRLSTVRGADEIVVMDQGRVVEKGTHDALMESRGLYWKLYSSGAFEED